MNNDNFKIPDLKSLFEKEAKQRGFNFDNPDDAKRLFSLLLEMEKEVEDLKKYFKKVPKTKSAIISLILKTRDRYNIGKKAKRLLNELKHGTKNEESLVDSLYSKSRKGSFAK